MPTNNFMYGSQPNSEKVSVCIMSNTTNSTKKPTKKQMFQSILDSCELTAGQVAFIKHEMELLDKKNSSDKKPTAQQMANDAIKTAILEGMKPNQLYTITDIIKDKDIGVCAELSNQRVSALMRQLKEDGKVSRIEDKRKAYFSKV